MPYPLTGSLAPLGRARSGGSPFDLPQARNIRALWMTGKGQFKNPFYGQTNPSVANNDKVLTWLDQSGNTFHAQYDIDAPGPVLKLDLNGYNGVSSTAWAGNLLYPKVNNSTLYNSGFAQAFYTFFSIYHPGSGSLQVVRQFGAAGYYGATNGTFTVFLPGIMASPWVITPAAGNGSWVGVITYDGTTLRVMLNGDEFSQAATGNLTLATDGGGTGIGDFSGSNKWTGQAVDFGDGMAALTLAERAQLSTRLGIRAAHYNPVRVIGVGDSLLFKTPLSGVHWLPGALAELNTGYTSLPRYRWYNKAHGGEDWTFLTGVQTAEVFPALSLVCGPGNNSGGQIVILEAGTNGLFEGNSVTTEFNLMLAYKASLDAYCAANSCSYTPVMATIPDRQDSLSPAAQASFNLRRADWNTTVRNYASAHSIVVIDMAAITGLGADGDALNPVLFEDTVHQTGAGNLLIQNQEAIPKLTSLGFF